MIPHICVALVLLDGTPHGLFFPQCPEPTKLVVCAWKPHAPEPACTALPYRIECSSKLVWYGALKRHVVCTDQTDTIVFDGIAYETTRA